MGCLILEEVAAYWKKFNLEWKYVEEIAKLRGLL
jgi:hypothetical protein